MQLALNIEDKYSNDKANMKTNSGEDDDDVDSNDDYNINWNSQYDNLPNESLHSLELMRMMLSLIDGEPLSTGSISTGFGGYPEDDEIFDVGNVSTSTDLLVKHEIGDDFMMKCNLLSQSTI
ncbi:unnamed protein product [Ambrosiozyma monospora]|uniref:Unnamed protein product n=1 Tax=Ambrosiozyma monospora TaxID=43982 RepID=A0ACB5SYZ5_AMBMO|nr:unnamed protein product [Ambrosiozyma monospora]